MASMRLVAAVLIACVAASLGLGATYAVTRDRIAEQERLREEASLREVLPGADVFERIEDAAVTDRATDVTEEVFVSVFRAIDENGESVGWAVRVAPRGYGGPIQMVVGLERDGQVAGASIITLNETPGLGSKVGSGDFLGQFVGWSSETIDQDARGLDAISGATKSSNAVRKGIVAAGHLYNEVLADLDGGV